MFYLDHLKIHTGKRWKIDMVLMYGKLFGSELYQISYGAGRSWGGRGREGGGGESETPFGVMSQIEDI